MNGLLNTSSISFDTLHSSTTVTSSSTVRGVGSVTGRVALAVGRLLLRGIDNVVVQRKLNVIASILPCDDYKLSSEYQSVYADLLELSRPGLYSHRVRTQALCILMWQIAQDQTNLLVEQLVQWPSIEISVFLSEILGCLPDEWLPPEHKSSPTQRAVARYYSEKLAPQVERHPAMPLIKFIYGLALKHEKSPRAILDAGFLDTMLCMYILDFSSPGMGLRNLYPLKSTLEACDSVLSDSQTFINHPLQRLWPRTITGGEHENNTAKRRLAWRALDSCFINRRSNFLDGWRSSYKESSTLPPYLFSDLLEFTRQDTYENNICIWAHKTINDCLMEEICWSPLNLACQDMPREDLREFFDAHVKGHFVTMRRLPGPTEMRDAPAAHCLLQFARYSIAHDPSLRHTFISAGILLLIFGLILDQRSGGAPYIRESLELLSSSPEALSSEINYLVQWGEGLDFTKQDYWQITVDEILGDRSALENDVRVCGSLLLFLSTSCW